LPSFPLIVYKGKHFAQTALLIRFSKDIYRMKEYWGENALEFVPERWLTDDKSRPFFPFSYGNRICIGHNFARMEMICFLAKFFLHHTVEVYQPVKWAFGVLRPTDGV